MCKSTKGLEQKNVAIISMKTLVSVKGDENRDQTKPSES